MQRFSVLEICAGAGGQALGVHHAGFDIVAAVEIEADMCATLRLNKPSWKVIEDDLRNVDGKQFRGIELLAGGVPCPPFSIAGKQLGQNDERDLFPEALRLIEESRPEAVMLENVRGFASERFASYREKLFKKIHSLGYSIESGVLNACDFGLAQLRPRFLLVGVKERFGESFLWPLPARTPPPTVGDAIGDLMSSRGWRGARAWRQKARGIAPTIVGGSKKHGGPDLGPTRAKREWKALGVDGHGIADEPPGADAPVDLVPRLTVPMVARLQGFPGEWRFSGGKTSSYRQVGNAFPPPVAHAVAKEIFKALAGEHHQEEFEPFLRSRQRRLAF
jgi:DNA (cytosine-5)-methyltransferase 1